MKYMYIRKDSMRSHQIRNEKSHSKDCRTSRQIIEEPRPFDRDSIPDQETSHCDNCKRPLLTDLPVLFFFFFAACTLPLSLSLFSLLQSVDLSR